MWAGFRKTIDAGRYAEGALLDNLQTVGQGAYI